MCKPAQVCVLTYIFSCFVDAAMHKYDSLHNKSGLIGGMQLPQNTSLYRLMLLYPREGADNPPAEFDSPKAAASKRLSLAFILLPVL